MDGLLVVRPVRGGRSVIFMGGPAGLSLPFLGTGSSKFRTKQLKNFSGGQVGDTNSSGKPDSQQKKSWIEGNHVVKTSNGRRNNVPSWQIRIPEHVTAKKCGNQRSPSTLQQKLEENAKVIYHPCAKTYVL